MTHQLADKLPKNADELDGVVKAAILLLSLDHDSASSLLKTLPRQTVNEVASVMAVLDTVPESLSNQVIEEFYTTRMVPASATAGDVGYTEMLLKDAFGDSDANEILATVRDNVTHMPFSFLKNTAGDSLLAFIRDEHPQTIAVILSHVPYKVAAEVLVGLTPDIQSDVVRRISTMEQPDASIIREIEESLHTRFKSVPFKDSRRMGGEEMIAEILSRCDRVTERAILEGIEEDDPDLAEQIRRLLFSIEDLNHVNDRDIQTILKEIDHDELCLALRTASESIRTKIFRNVSSRAANLIHEDMEYMGPVRLSEVESAQQRIIDVVRRLEESGEIIVEGRSNEKDVVV